MSKSPQDVIRECLKEQRSSVAQAVVEAIGVNDIEVVVSTAGSFSAIVGAWLVVGVAGGASQEGSVARWTVGVIPLELAASSGLYPRANTRRYTKARSRPAARVEQAVLDANGNTVVE